MKSIRLLLLTLTTLLLSASLSPATGASADLNVSISGPSDPQLPNTDITYYIYAGNAGPDDATAVTLTNSLPAGLTFVSLVTTRGACSNSAGLITCDLGDIAAGDQATIKVNAHLTTPGDYLVSASILALEDDPVLDDNTASAIISVIQQAPVITTPPQSQSVSSGSNVTFTVSVAGVPPLYYQWQFNGTNLLRATNDTLLLTNVGLRNYGNYNVVVTNQFGSAISDPALLGIDDDLTFHLLELRTNGLVSLNDYSLIGYAGGGMAVSSNYVLVTGGGSDYSTPTSARHNARDLSGGTKLATGLSALVANLRSGKIYSLGNGNNPITYNYNYGTNNFYAVNTLLELNETTGQPNGTRITLSTNIPITSYNQWIFSGVDRIVLYGYYSSGGYHVYNISLPSGQVTDLGSMPMPSHNYSYTWAFWGLAEYYGGAIHLVYNSDDYTVSRVSVPSGAVTTVSSFNYSPGYYWNTLGFSLSASRWYFYAPWDTTYSHNVLGSSKAIYTTDPSFPNIITDPRSQSVYVTSNVVFSASCAGTPPMAYQWYCNGAPIAGATNLTLVLTNVQPANAGTYLVVVQNTIGSVQSGSATLSVISTPYITSNPTGVNTFPGSNAVFTAYADGAPPLYYQWQLNGTNLPGATANRLVITNVSILQAGAYSLLVSNIYGTAVSSAAALTVIIPDDDGTAFRIVDLLTSNSKVVDHNNTSGDDRGGMAASSKYLFYSGDSASIRFSLDDMSGQTVIATYPNLYDTLASNLRTETAYLLADGTNRLQGTYVSSAQFTSLLELNSDGTLSGRQINLSMAIPLGYQYANNQTGIFSGWDRIIIHNGKTIYKIALPSGQVSILGSMAEFSHQSSENWAYWGVAEHSGGFTYLCYVGNYDYVIHRTRVPDGQTTVVHTFSNLSDMASFTVSIPRKRWYFHHEYNSQFGGSSSGETAGYADASFTVNSGIYPDHFDWAPIPSPQLSTVPFLATLSAKNTDGKLVTNFSGPVTLSGLASPAGTNVSISPTSVVATNGVWSGFVTVLQANTNMYLRAADTNSDVGNSTNFIVRPGNDLAISVAGSPNPVAWGQFLTYTVRVTNSGPLAATGVMVTNFLATNTSITFFSASSSQGSCAYNSANGQVVCDLGTVTNYADISIVGIPLKTGLLTERSSVGRAGADPDTSNNSLMIFTSVTLPILTISDASAVEGNSGLSTMTFTVSLTPPPTNTVTVNYATATVAGGASSSGPYQDFIPNSGMLTFAPGVTNQTISIGILGDTLYETNEIFYVVLSSATNGYIGRNQGVGTIINDDPLPTVSINDVSLFEGNSGTNTAVFTVTLSGVTGSPVDVGYATSNGTATAGSDYVAKIGRITFAAETTNLVQTIGIQIIGDTNAEPNETFYLRLTGITNAIGIKTNGLCTILNDDALGVFDHFTWGPIGSNVANTPFAVTVTAKDVSENTITTFNSTVALSGWTSHAITNVLVGDETAATSTTWDGTMGYAFTPNRDLQLTHFRHDFGTKVSIWTTAGTLIFSEAVVSNPGTWVETPLTSPVTLSAGTQYLLAAYTGGGIIYYSGNNVFTFPDGTIDIGYYGGGDVMPPTAINSLWGMVGLRYTIGSNNPVAITPTVSGSFTAGLWSGSLTVLERATNMTLQADDGANHLGVSAPFSVSSDVYVDLQVKQSVGLNQVQVGNNITFTAIVSNAGPGTATGVCLSNTLPAGLTFVNAPGLSWTTSVSGQLLTATLPSLAPGASSIFMFMARADAPGAKTNIITATCNENETKSANNLSAARFLAYADSDNDGMWDDWEILYGFNPNDPADASLDSDGDGLTNLQEFLAGTNPNDSSSYLRISSTSLSDGSMQIHCWAVPDKQYTLERTDSLQAPNWTSVTNFVLPAAQDVLLIDPMPAEAPTRYYRIRVGP